MRLTELKKYSALFLFVVAAFVSRIALAGDPIHGVDVKLGAKDGKVYTATSDAQGKLDFGSVPDGEYDLYCSYEQCTKMAINTKGTGVAGRSSLDAASKDAAKFQIDLPNNGTEATLTKDVSTGKNNPNVRFSITYAWSASTPSLHVRISRGKQASEHHYIGHVTIVK
jgi:hypothetical protein